MIRFLAVGALLASAIPLASPVLAQTVNGAGAVLTNGPIFRPPNAFSLAQNAAGVNVKAFGAKGDGVTDDTTALQAALDYYRRNPDGTPTGFDFYGSQHNIYLPKGVYLVSKTLDWFGCCVAVIGDGPGATIIRLAPNAPGFGNAAAPKAVLLTPSGNQSFRQYVQDLAIEVGSGNAGAIALDFIGSNVSAVQNVRLSAAVGSGATGLAMTRQWPGPQLVKNVLVEGFDYGIDVGTAEYSVTIEQVTTSNQHVAGLRNSGNTLPMRRFLSMNSVPAILNPAGTSNIALISSTLIKGAPGATAIVGDGTLFARSVTISGYGKSFVDNGISFSGSIGLDRTIGPPVTLFSNARGSLNLSVQNTPTYTLTSANSVGFTANYYGDTALLQPALDSGKAVVYFPSSIYFSFAQAVVHVPATVRRITGFHSIVNGGGIRFVVDQASTLPLIIDGFGYGVTVQHNAARPVVLKDGGYDYASAAGAGDLFLEDVVQGPLTIQPGQRVWARQYNNETAGTKIFNNGGTFWALGLKTENVGTVIDASNSAKNEVFAALIYPAQSFSITDLQQPAFRVNNASLSISASLTTYIQNGIYSSVVIQTRGAETRTLPVDAIYATGRSGRFSLFTAKSP